MCSGTENVSWWCEVWRTQTLSVTAAASLVTSECDRSDMTKWTGVLIALMSGCKSGCTHSVLNVYNYFFQYKILCSNILSLSMLIPFLCISKLMQGQCWDSTRRSTWPRGRYRWWATIYKHFKLTSTPAGQYHTTVPSQDQPPSTSSLGTDSQQRTTNSESTSPVIESPSAGDNVEACVTCSLYCVYKVDFPFSYYCSEMLHCDAAIVLLVWSYMFGNKKLNW